MVALAVAVTLAMPEALVVAVSDDSVALAPEAGTAQVTDDAGDRVVGAVAHRHLQRRAESGRDDSRLRRAAPGDDACAAPAVLVRLKVARRATPATAAVTA